MSQSSFDFSPSAINRCLEASKSTTPSVLKPRRSFTPSFLDLSPPDLSPIDFITNSAKRNAVSLNSTTGSNSSLSKYCQTVFFPSKIKRLHFVFFYCRCDESLPFELEGDQQNFINISNINNRHLNMSSILDDLGLKEYKTMFEIEEVKLCALLLLCLLYYRVLMCFETGYFRSILWLFSC